MVAESGACNPDEPSVEAKEYEKNIHSSWVMEELKGS